MSEFVMVDITKIAEEAGCDGQAAQIVATRVLENLYKTALVRGASGSLKEAEILGAEAAYFLGGLYVIACKNEYGPDVYETVMRFGLREAFASIDQQMEAWEKTLTDAQRAIVQATTRGNE